MIYHFNFVIFYDKLNQGCQLKIEVHVIPSLTKSKQKTIWYQIYNYYLPILVLSMICNKIFYYWYNDIYHSNIFTLTVDLYY